MRKSTNLTKDARKNTKYTFFDEYYDFFTLRKTPISVEGIEQLSKELVYWAQNDPDAYKVSQFFIERSIGGKTIKKWKERSPLFEEAHEFAKQIIGNRREVGALKKKLSEGIVASSMAFYDQEWKEMAEWRASLRQDKDQNTQPFTVVIENYPTSEIVPEKK